jgi:hypothetical protein
LSAGTTGCTLSFIESKVEATGYGTCTIRVSADATSSYTTATYDLVFSFIDPAAIPNPPAPPSGGGGGFVALPEEVVAPAQTIPFSKEPRLRGTVSVGERISVSKFRFEKPKRIIKVKYSWYRCSSAGASSSTLDSSCTKRPKAKGLTYKLKKADRESYVSVLIKAKTKQGDLIHLLSTRVPIGD